MKVWTVQRPAVIWIETTVKAETLENALEVADADFYNGEYIEVRDGFSIDDYRYWAKDETGQTYNA
jgi:hypothetical protein